MPAHLRDLLGELLDAELVAVGQRSRAQRGHAVVLTDRGSRVLQEYHTDERCAVA
jgi:hypothetical protein